MPKIVGKSCLLFAVQLEMNRSDFIIFWDTIQIIYVNEMKTRIMVCGSSTDNVKIKFKNKVLDVVDQYKYLENIINRTKRSNEDIFGENYQYLCN